ncbi:DUF2975 domain-containing protein [Marinactinospora thermotolerans]|uniref:DUF2975 domain-containing protein n=1 Tax=Marinactinospora thermotolerans DSM 45154 TaxID=1122192 RepID=A0A1T4NH43_9ACTN|nr:DUF2975 domain-containing protein [Marinactinospora thermotolerans]SJZ78058.1 Protein of unknown function [Marinactinospora thermotolerans DSM 45154]
MENQTRWSRLNDHLLEGALGVALLLVGLFDLLLPLLGVAGLLPMETTRLVHIDTPAPPPGIMDADGMTLRAASTAELALTDPGLPERLLLALPGLTGTVLLVVVLGLLLRMARSLRSGDVFIPGNVWRLHTIALAVLLIGLAVPLVEAVSTDLLVGATPLHSMVPFHYEFSTGHVFLALLVSAAAEAFRHGSRLRADTEGLV